MRFKSSFRFNKIQLANDLVFAFISFIVAALLAVFIAPHSRDFENYSYFYNSLTNNSFDANAQRFEFGFQFLSILTSKIFPEQVKYLYWIVIFISLSIKYFLIRKYSKNNMLKVTILFVAYLISFALVFELNQLRAAIAISFGFLSFYYFDEKKNIKSIATLFIAFSMHYSAAVFLMGLLIIFFVKCGRTNLIFLLITIISLISKSLLSFVEFLNPISAEYRQNYDMVEFGLKSITLILPLIYILYAFIVLKHKTDSFKSLLLFCYFATVFSLVVSDIPVYAIRILEMVEVSVIFMGACRSYLNYSDFLLGIMIFLIIAHKALAYIFVNPLFYF